MIVLRIRIVLRSADGVANHQLASELGTSRPTVLRWRRRFEQAGLGACWKMPLDRDASDG